MKQQSVKAQKDFVEDEDLKVRLEGFPKEVADAVNQGYDWVQMNPENTFVMQNLKEDWMRYAVPMVATCLPAFRRKALIAQYESSLLNLGAHSFVHVSYGDSKSDILPDITQLNAVNALFKRAMTGAALATTNHLCKAEVIQPDLNEMFSDDKYRDVNAEILSAGGISGIIVSGRAEDGSNFASAQVSMQTAAMRIKQARDDFSELMNRVNERLNGKHGSITHSASGNIPQFVFPPVDLADSQKFQEVCRALWEKGVVSTRTMLQSHGYDMDQEMERMKGEPQRESNANDVQSVSDGEGRQGRPQMDDSERRSDPIKSMTGKQPKPSNPEGSL